MKDNLCYNLQVKKLKVPPRTYSPTLKVPPRTHSPTLKHSRLPPRTSIKLSPQKKYYLKVLLAHPNIRGGSYPDNFHFLKT